MKRSVINFNVELDDENIPERIFWDASDKGEDESAESQAISLSIWDPLQKNTLRIDLWTKEMPVDEMKRFYIDCLGGMAQSLMNATGDEFMASQMEALCEKLVKHVEKEYKQGEK
jgi:gliding motility-associated protein GldC